jgi:endonuclease/exonuclease/phosphatase family metal-dependent hydrolase
MASVKKSLKIGVLTIVLLPLVYLATVIILGMVTNYKPAESELISSMDEGFFINDSNEFSMLTWNLGYGGLGANMDFFYDGGIRVRDSLYYEKRNLNMIYRWLEDNDSVNFILLQEVDVNSKRSYHINMRDSLNRRLSGHFPFFALNYKVKFVPVPFFEPMGKVESGVMIFSKDIPALSHRYALPGKYSWPKQLFMLDGCMLVNRYRIENSQKELVIINTHFEAYDGGEMRTKQMKRLQQLLLEEDKKGNYFIVGGDWNQSPPAIKTHFDEYVFDTVHLMKIPSDFIERGWEFVYDSLHPTNRWLDMPFDKAKNGVTIIDFFLVSENVEVLSCNTQPSDFKYSDHQPVIMRFRLKK